MQSLLSEYWPHLTIAFSILDVALIVIFLPWTLLSKKDATATVAWCLLILFVPLLGALLFWGFGHNYLLYRVRHQRAEHHKQHSRIDGLPRDGGQEERDLGALAERVGAYPARRGNALTVYHQTDRAFADLLDAVAAARHYIHLEYFILRSDVTGARLLELLTRKAKEGVEVRLLYDALGSLHLKRRALRPLVQAGGQAVAFLPLNPFHSLIRVNLRNHRKITVIDGRVGFTGGMNIGDEYLGKSPVLGYWRDCFVRLEGPAVSDLQRVFHEDWVFARGETLTEEKYAPLPPLTSNPSPPKGGEGGNVSPLSPLGGRGVGGEGGLVQIAESGPDQDVNTIREIYFLAMIGARRRLWIASPYLVPDNGLFDALRAARYRGVDVRILTLLRPDHYISYYAGLYYAAELLDYGVRIYLYRKGMMHAKMVMADGRWGMVGSANLDNRSLHLNFEIGCILHDVEQIAELEAAFERDLEDAVLLDRRIVKQSSLATRVLANACRLFTPTL